MKLKHIILSLTFFYLSSNGIIFSQNSEKDIYSSLSNLSEEEKIERLNALSWENRGKNPSLALKYGFKSLDYYATVTNKNLFCETFNFIGVIYGDLGQLDSSFYYYNRALELAEEYNDSSQIAYSLNNIGDYYYKSALFAFALEYIYRAYNIFENIGEERGMAYTLNDIGEIYLTQKNYPKALDYFERSGKIRFNQKDYRTYAKVLLNIASVNARLGNNEEALDIYKKAREYCERSGYVKGKSWAYAGESEVFANQTLFEKALEYRFRAVEIDLGIDNKYGEITNYNQIGSIYIQLGDLDEAKKYLNKALAESRAIDFRDQTMQSYKLLLRLSIEAGDYRNAYKYLDLYESLEDSIYSQENANKIADLQAAFLTERKERENQLLKKDLEIEERTRNFLIIISLIIAGAVVLFVKKFRSEKNANYKLHQVNMELNELNSQKDRILSIIGHDLKNPVGSIRNLLQLLITDYSNLSEEEKRETIKHAYNSSDRLANLLAELLEWGHLSRGIIDFEIEDVNLTETVIETTEFVKTSAHEKNIKIDRDECNVSIKTDKRMLKTVLRNIISNAIKFTNTGGNISISCAEEKDFIKINIKDSGIGIAESEIEDLFKIDKLHSTRGTMGEIGTGLGLPIANEFIKRCGGSIDVISKLGEGTSFIISLPNIPVDNKRELQSSLD